MTSSKFNYRSVAFCAVLRASTPAPVPVPPVAVAGRQMPVSGPLATCFARTVARARTTSQPPAPGGLGTTTHQTRGAIVKTFAFAVVLVTPGVWAGAGAGHLIQSLFATMTGVL